MIIKIMAVFSGAGTGALLRWWLNVRFNDFYQNCPLGTLAANLSGAFFIGLTASLFVFKPSIPPDLRLFIITGLLGGLTTFSTFSLEVVTLIESGRTGGAILTTGLNLGGSIVLTICGLALGRLIWGR